MPQLKKRYIALLSIALLVAAFLFLLPRLSSYVLVKLLADNLQVEAQIEDVELNLFTGRAVLNKLFIVGQHQSNLEGAQLLADLDMSRLIRGELVAESVRLQGVRLQLVEDSAGELVALVPLSSGDLSAGDKDTTGASVEIPLFSLLELELIDVQLDVDALQIKGQLTVDSLQLKGLSTLQSQPGHLALRANWNEAPVLIEGTIAPFRDEPWFEGDIRLQQLQLSELNPYLPDHMNGLAGSLSMHWQGRASSDHIALEADIQAQDIVLALGRLQVHGTALSWQGEITASGLEQSLAFTVSGNVSGSGLSIRDEQRQTTVVQMEAFELQELRLNEATELIIKRLNFTNMQALDRGEENQRLLFGRDIQVHALSYQDDRLVIGAIHGEEIVSTLRLTADRELVSQGVLSTSLEALRSKDAVSTDTATADEDPLQWRIDDITMLNSRLNFFDEKFEHPLHLKLAVDELILRALDSSKPQQMSEVNLNSGIGDFGRITLGGQFAVLAPEAGTQLKGSIKALPVPLVSPYVEDLLGYELVSGQFDHEFDIAINEGRIEASNELNLRKLKVNKLEGVTAQAPLPVPLGFALNLLRDNDDHISLSVPLKGQLDDPQFGIDQAISKALGKALQGGSALYLKLALQPYGAIWMGAEMGLKLAGQMRLDPMSFPALQSDMGVAQQDYAAKLALILTQRPGVHLQLCGKSGAEDFEALIQIMTKATQATESIAARPETSADAAQSTAPTAEQQKQMTTLADARARGLKHWLVKDKGIDSSRVYLCKASADRAGKFGGVELSL